MVQLKQDYGMDHVWSREFIWGLNNTTGDSNFRTVTRYLSEIALVLLLLFQMLFSKNFKLLVLPMVFKYLLIMLEQFYNYKHQNCSGQDLFVSTLPVIHFSLFSLVVFGVLPFRSFWFVPLAKLLLDLGFMKYTHKPQSNLFLTTLVYDIQYILIALWVPAPDVRTFHKMMLPSSIFCGLVSLVFVFYFFNLLYKIFKNCFVWQNWTILDLMLFLVLSTGPVMYMLLQAFTQFIQTTHTKGKVVILVFGGVLVTYELLYFLMAICSPGTLKHQW